MDSRKFVLKETAIVTLGQTICVSVMLGVYALLGNFDRSIWLGGICGGICHRQALFLPCAGYHAAAKRHPGHGKLWPGKPPL